MSIFEYLFEKPNKMRNSSILISSTVILCLLLLVTTDTLSQDSVVKSPLQDSVFQLLNKQPTLNFNQKQISGLPFQNLSSFGLMAPSAYSLKGGNMYYYGRESAGNHTFIDGMQVKDASNLPIRIIRSYSLFSRQVPINMATSPGAITSLEIIDDLDEFTVMFDINTDQAFNKQGYTGEVFVFVPLGSVKKREEGKKIPSLLIAGKYSWTNNNDPVWKETEKLTSDKLQSLTDNPLRPTDWGTGTFLNSSFVSSDDMINQKVPDNNGKSGIYPYIKLDLPISKYMNLSIGNMSSIDKSDVYNGANRIFNSTNNNVITRRNFDNFLSLKHDISINDKLKIGYNLNLQYSNYYYKNANPEFDNDFFDYGYVGKFTSYKTPTYELGSDTVNGQYYQNVWLLNSWDYDTLVDFQPSNINSGLSAYTSDYYNIFSGQPYGHYQNLDDIVLGGGMINGVQPQKVYGLFNNTGYTNSTYQENNFEKFRASLLFEVDYGMHHILLGGEYNKESSSNYSIAPSGLWNLMRGLTNFHLKELDKDNPMLLIYNGHVDTIIYRRKYDGNAQRDFDKNLREVLGLPIDGLDYILIDSYDRENNTINYYDEYGVMKEVSTPTDLLSLDMFSNEELLNDGLSYVSYSGYDYNGNKVKGKSDPYSFFDDYSIGASEKQYWAAFAQDEFTWKNLHVQLGLRIDVYDANQPVLKDEYSLFPIFNVNDAIQMGELEFTRPDNIGDDYSVYVDKIRDPTRVTGYRNGGTWYNAEGDKIIDPSLLDAGSGISPYLKYPSMVQMEGDWEPSMTFEDYSRSVNILPQISIDYTLFKRLNIYTNYTSSTQNPYYYSNFRPEQYYFFNNTNSNIMSNPALKPMRTDKFFVGIKGILFNKLMLDAAYLTTTVENFVVPGYIIGAYPTNYTTLVNDPNRVTTPGYEVGVSYVNTTLSGLTGGISYTQLFPEELKYSSFNVSDKVLNANLGYCFGRGSNYKGASWMSRSIFQGISANMYYQHRSGVPYFATRNGFYNHVDRTPNINMVNINIQKDFLIGQKASLNVYLIIENLFNFQNVFDVYSDTGDASDDGFLSDPSNERYIEGQLNPDSYRLLYQMSLYNPQYYDIPRIWRIGLTFRY